MKEKRPTRVQLMAAAFHDAMDERFHPVERELAALVLEVRRQADSYQQIGKAIAGIEHMLRSWDEAVKEMHERAVERAKKTVASYGLKPKVKGAKVIPFKKKPPKIKIKEPSL